MPSTLVVIPTFNEALSIEEVIARALKSTPDLDLLIVDDASPDGTGAVVADIAATEPRVNVMHRTSKQGLGPAYRAGLGWGLERGYDVLVEMDADLSHDPAVLPTLLGTTAYSDLVIGSRYVPGGKIENWALHRRMLSAGGNLYVRLLTGIGVHDVTSGFRAYRRAVLEEIDLASLRSDGYSFQLESALRAWRAGFVITEIPITFVERHAGASKISRTVVLEALWRVLGWSLRGTRRRALTHPRSVASQP